MMLTWVVKTKYVDLEVKSDVYHNEGLLACMGIA
jgi:hypothetical protein